MKASHGMKLSLTVAFLAILHAVVVFAAFLAPYDYAEQHRDYPFAPPTHVHFIDTTGRFHLRPFVYGVTQESPGRPAPRAGIEVLSHRRRRPDHQPYPA